MYDQAILNTARVRIQLCYLRGDQIRAHPGPFLQCNISYLCIPTAGRPASKPYPYLRDPVDLAACRFSDKLVLIWRTIWLYIHAVPTRLNKKNMCHFTTLPPFPRVLKRAMAVFWLHDERNPCLLFGSQPAVSLKLQLLYDTGNVTSLLTNSNHRIDLEIEMRCHKIHI